MTTTNEMLDTLNTLRTAAGMKPLKAWKESRMKLEAAIATLDLNRQMREKFEARQEELDQQTTRQEVKDAHEVKEEETVKEVAPKTKRTTNVAAILKSLGFTTVAELKVARAKLRRNKVAKNAAAIKAFFKK